MTVSLREAGPADAATLHTWRNDPATRAASYSPDVVDWADHVEWLRRRLADPGTRLWIADGIGTVRAERSAPGTGELHITIAPEARGQGHATRLLEAASRAAAAELGLRRVFGRVKATNVPSRRAFARAGFTAQDEVWTRDLVGEPVVAIVQARMGSTRLPGKVLAEVGGRPLLLHLLERAGAAGTLDAIWVATTELARDDVIAELSREHGYPVHRGSEEDVLGRFAATADAAGAATVVRLTADCPLMVPEAIDLVVGALAASGADLATNAPSAGRTWPDGLDVEAFSRDTLLAAAAAARDPLDREHVTRWLHAHRTVAVVHHDPPLGDVRITVDTAEDLERVRTLLEDSEAAEPRDLESLLARLA